MAPRHVRDLVLLAVAVVAVSTAAPLIRYAAAPALAVAFWRTALALPVTGSGMVAQHLWPRRYTRQPRLDRHTTRLSLLAGAYLAGHFATWVPSLSFTSVASSVALVTTQPVWTALIARLRGQDVPAAVWQGIGLALAGVLILTGVDFSVSARALFGDLLALVGGVLAALYVTAGSEARQRLGTASYSTVCYATASGLLLVVCLVAGQALAGYDGKTWLTLVALAIGPQLLGHTVVNQVLKRLSPTVVSVAILFEIVGAALLAWVFFDEVPPWAAVPAALLIGAGTVRVIAAMARPVPRK